MMAEMQSEGPQAKGTAFLGILKFIKTQPQGEDLLPKVLANLSPPAAQVLRRKVIAIADYPYPIFAEFLRVVDQFLGRGDLAICYQLGRFTATRDIQSIYNPYQKKARPGDLVRDSDLIWRSYYSHAGRAKTEEPSPGHVIFRIYDFPAMDHGHCRLMEGWLAQAMVESGAVWIEEIHEILCASRGDPYHEFSGRYHLAEGV